MFLCDYLFHCNNEFKYYLKETLKYKNEIL